MQAAVAELEKVLGVTFSGHQRAPTLTSAPGLGPVLGARVLAEVGDDATLLASPGGPRSFAGTTTITRVPAASTASTTARSATSGLVTSIAWKSTPSAGSLV